ncbi:DUF2911 domain-containing protein [Penaeicola halotolerans]|uniref:DUF2911 domain-containing protein n=1 Tax=Penaeicola halotolerans TaxID=2793196 RepID=UPI001CF7FA5C|nr:DUF2911 domain-containing protein [Penaeicola halotolerans]
MKKNLMNTIALLALLMGMSACGGSSSTEAESTVDSTAMSSEEPEQRISPLVKKDGKIGNVNVAIQYGSPAVRGRVIWGELEPYDEVWRTGANEATNVKFDQDVMIEGQALRAGHYSLFTIPRAEGAWTVIFNSEWDLEHGAYQYNAENDVLRVEVMPEFVDEVEENLSFTITETGLELRWDKLKLPISIK